jgi:predicted small integral membrane protein
MSAKPKRTHFLPIVTNWFDRLFIGIYLFVALELVWLRFIEVAIPLIFCHILAFALGVLILWRG